MGYILKQGNKQLYDEVFDTYGSHVLFVCPYCGSKWAMEKYTCEIIEERRHETIYKDRCPTCDILSYNITKPLDHLSFEEIVELNDNGITLDG